MYSKLRDQKGFTLLEITFALVIVGILGSVLWSLGNAVARNRLATWRSADIENTISVVNVALRSNVRNAGIGMLSSYNYGPINVKPAQVGGVAFDTLFVAQPDSAFIPNASLECPTLGPSCIVLLGRLNQSFVEGDIVVTGSPATGARVLQVSGDPAIFRTACGADCLTTVTCQYSSDSDLGQSPTGSYISVTGADRGGTLTPGGFCSQPFDKNGIACQEEWTSRSFERQYAQCSTSAKTSTFTEVPVQDITATVGYPLGPTELLSSSSGAPRVRTQKISLIRFFVRNASTSRAELVKQAGLNSDGAWTETLPLAGPIAGFQVETLHQNNANWQRGIGIEEGDLMLSSSNRIRASTPSAQAPQGYTYTQGYYTVALSRVIYTLPIERTDGTVGTETHTVVLNATPSLGGGAGRS